MINLKNSREKNYDLIKIVFVSYFIVDFVFHVNSVEDRCFFNSI